MLIKQGKLTIRSATAFDADRLCSWYNDGNIMAHAGFPNGLGTTVQAIRAQILQNGNKNVKRLIIEENQVPIGEMCYCNKGDGAAEIGIKIVIAAKQNQGLGTTLLKMLINKLFAIGYNKIILDTNLTNSRARHVYEKIGFVKVSERLNSRRDQLGELQSYIDYELRRDNWSY
jgi:RimJ/RimL family protein N-acetyltransferase